MVTATALATATAVTQQQQLAQAAAITLAAKQQIASVQQQTATTALALWNSYTRHNDAALADFLRRFLPALQGSQKAVGQLTQSYLTTSIQAGAGTTFTLPRISVDAYSGPVLRSGTPYEEVYKRPFVQLWSDLRDKKSPAASLQAAAARLDAMTRADVLLAHTHAARATLVAVPELPNGLRVVGFRRVLSGGHSCELCVLAASQRYRVGDLQPIHNRCGCVVAPIVGHKDQGQYINVVSQALSDAEPATERELYGHKIVIHQHGEMGPVLTASGQSFMTESEANSR